ncbi:DNA polymerase III subunit beta [Hugonella massiliensis]|uniref:DNA polymerase III subunit beta n=1 Tax=Hugonella massiliensis TaxID=1720315 RepID=UPI00073F43E6|nr:DNA polymerase III subunit beta [Hugonella massiliensis]MDD6730233.1 DNA polymerase III subunit beta [Eggerthellaceae bacterium]
MKFSINRTELQTALGVVAKGAASRSTLPILSGILLKASHDTLTLEATDLNLSIRCALPAFIEEEGQTVIPSKLITDVVKSLPDAAVHVDANDESAKILCETSAFSLKSLNAEDFPGFPDVDPESSISIPFATFSRMVKRVARVVSRDESRPILTGVLVEAEDGVLRMVATDSYRLAVTDTDFTADSEGFKAVIAGTFLSDLAALAPNEDNITLSLAENQIVATYSGTTFVNRKIEGTYPRYQQLIPDQYKTRAKFDTKQLTEAVKRTSLLSNRTAPVKFDLNSASNTTQVSTVSQDIGEARETIASEIEGEDTDISFNFSYVLDGLSSVETDAVYLELQGPMRQGIFKSEEEERYLYLVMPMRVS